MSINRPKTWLEIHTFAFLTPAQCQRLTRPPLVVIDSVSPGQQFAAALVEALTSASIRRKEPNFFG